LGGDVAAIGNLSLRMVAFAPARTDFRQVEPDAGAGSETNVTRTESQKANCEQLLWNREDFRLEALANKLAADFDSGEITP
jgi:hypothetical protein